MEKDHPCLARSGFHVCFCPTLCVGNAGCQDSYVKCSTSSIAAPTLIKLKQNRFFFVLIVIKFSFLFHPSSDFLIDCTVVFALSQGHIFFFSRGLFSCHTDAQCLWSPMVSSSSRLLPFLQMQQYQRLLDGYSLLDCQCFISKLSVANLPPIVALNRSATCRSLNFSRLNMSILPVRFSSNSASLSS